MAADGTGAPAPRPPASAPSSPAAENRLTEDDVVIGDEKMSVEERYDLLEMPSPEQQAGLRKVVLDDLRIHTFMGGLTGAAFGYFLVPKLFKTASPKPSPSSASSSLAEYGSVAWERTVATRMYSFGRLGKVAQPVAFAALCGLVGMVVAPVSLGAQETREVFRAFPPPPAPTLKQRFKQWRKSTVFKPPTIF